MPGVRDLADQLWRGEVDTAALHPLTVRVPEGEELADGVLFYKGIAAATAVDTGDGLVLLDTGAVNDTRHLHTAVRRWRPQARLAAAVFSHHHVDHVFGVGPFEAEAAERGWPAPVVYAHELVPAAFDRYRRTAGWNTAINLRQFELPPERFRWPEQYRYPDITYRDQLQVTVGGLTSAMHHARGDTDAPPRSWLHERRTRATGALLSGAPPDARRPPQLQPASGRRRCARWRSWARG